jgi:hypothetical protein
MMACPAGLGQPTQCLPTGARHRKTSAVTGNGPGGRMGSIRPRTPTDDHALTRGFSELAEFEVRESPGQGPCAAGRGGRLLCPSRATVTAPMPGPPSPSSRPPAVPADYPVSATWAVSPRRRHLRRSARHLVGDCAARGRAVASDGDVLSRFTTVMWSRFAIATGSLVRSVVPATATAFSLRPDDPGRAKCIRSGRDQRGKPTAL